MGSILRKSYCERFSSITLSSGEQLPDGVTHDDIIKVIYKGKELKRDDILTSEILMFPNSEKRYIEVSGDADKVKIIYRIPYEPIRYIVIENKGTFSYDETIGYYFLLPEEYNIREGDILKCGDITYNILNIGFKDDKFMIVVDNNSTGTKNLERIIDELTVTDPPFDRLYTEFILAKAARFSEDYETENRALANYNALLEEYQRFFLRNGKSLKASRFYNFWS